ncbi:MAG: ferritin [Candidatus Ornithospirochaeta sp.]|nr:ferritin [Candidatus Ornithospirochaeta sp.]
MDSKVSELLNDQINKEFYSAYLYLDMANFYTDKGLDGFANWYEIQAKEEQDHALLMYQYLHNNGEKVTLGAIAKPDKAFSTLMDPLKAGLEHEKYVTSLINNIYAAAIAANDYRTTQFLDWFIKEQGEEEKNSQDLITKMELFGDDARSLYMLNSELSSRVYSAPSLVLD